MTQERDIIFQFAVVRERFYSCLFISFSFLETQRSSATRNEIKIKIPQKNIILMIIQ